MLTIIGEALLTATRQGKTTERDWSDRFVPRHLRDAEADKGDASASRRFLWRMR